MINLNQKMKNDIYNNNYYNISFIFLFEDSFKKENHIKNKYLLIQ